mmetsp:Transcript_63076/g.112100  ORF Transcript_63076/g.112100 Transcript_63076/m.112100 type:complete len:797 (-) Transcript_63076:71-2461(-)
MAGGKAVADSSSEGRALLQTAVGAIQSGRWDDLTNILQENAPQLQAARLRLEQQALERHASKAAQARGETPLLQRQERGMEPKAEGSRLVKIASAVASWADRFPWSALLVGQLVVIACFAPAFGYHGYIMDDTVGIMRNPNVVGEEFSLTELLRRDFWGLPMHGSGWTNKSFRPLTTLTFRLNYLLHGLNSCGFHVTNILLHCLTSILVGRMATTSLGLSGSWAAMASVFFGVHPVHTENVLYLVCRADILAALLGLLAINAYSSFFCPPRPLRPLWPILGSRPFDNYSPTLPAGNWSAAGLLWPSFLIIASGLCKESGFTLFAIPILMELLDFVNLQATSAHRGEKLNKRSWKRIRLRVGLLLASTLLTFIARYRHTGGTSINMSPQDNPISFESDRQARVLSYAFLHGIYARLLVWPHYLCYDYSMDAIPIVRSFTDCRLLLPLTAYLGFVSVVCLLVKTPPKHRRAALISLALLVVSYLPASNILFPVGTVVGERLMYVPSAGYCLAVVVALHSYLEGSRGKIPANIRPVATSRGLPGRALVTKDLCSWGAGSDRPEALRRGSKVLLMAGVSLAYLSVRCFVRVTDWESSDILFIRDGARQPTSSKTQFNLGITYMQMQEWEAAISALVRCAHADPLSSLPFYRIGQIEILRGNFLSAESWLAAALDKFGASLMVRDEEVFHDLALAMFQTGKVEQSETRLRIALQLNPDFAKGWNNLGCCMASRMNLQDAVRAVRKAVQLNPENPQYWANLAVLSQHTGDPNTAESAMSTAYQIWPEMPPHKDCAWEFAPAG